MYFTVLARTVSHLYLNGDYCIYSRICIVCHMKTLAPSAAMTMPATAGLGVAHVAVALRTLKSGPTCQKGGIRGCLPCRVRAKGR
jgi:hypothetical protein